MKKLIKSLSILMMSVMLILPAAVPTQAEEVNDNTNEVVTYNTTDTAASTYSIPSGFTKKAIINANNVNFRTAGMVSLGQIHKGYVIYLSGNTIIWEGKVMRECYCVKLNKIGYVSQAYYDLVN